MKISATTPVAAASGHSAASVVGHITSIVPDGIRPRIYVQPGAQPSKRTAPYRRHRITVVDARPRAAELSLDREGVRLARAPSAVADFYDDDQVRDVYYPEVERLIAAETGATAVTVFDHTRRIDTGDRRADGRSDVRQSVRIAHNDYTEVSGPRRSLEVLQAAGHDGPLPARFAIINVWRPIVGPVRRAPLALVDASTLQPGDLLAADLIYPDRVGEVYELATKRRHAWLYFPEMTPDEAVVFKSFDSAVDGRARWAPHTGFAPRGLTADAPIRESIEIRAVATFGEDAGEEAAR